MKKDLSHPGSPKGHVDCEPAPTQEPKPTTGTCVPSEAPAADPAAEDETLALQMTLLHALSRGNGGGFTEAEADAVFDWAKETITNNRILELVLKRKVVVCFKGGEIAFGPLRPEPGPVSGPAIGSKS